LVHARALLASLAVDPPELLLPRLAVDPPALRLPRLAVDPPTLRLPRLAVGTLAPRSPQPLVRARELLDPLPLRPWLARWDRVVLIDAPGMAPRVLVGGAMGLRAARLRVVLPVRRPVLVGPVALPGQRARVPMAKQAL